MKTLYVLLLIGTCITQAYSFENFVTRRPPQIPSNDADFKRGLCNVKHFKAIPNDGIDDTAALQLAFDTAYKYHLVAYMPGGTYNVSDTIDMMQDDIANAEQKRRYAHIIVGEKGNRPTIKLADWNGFNDVKNLKAVFQLWHHANPAFPKNISYEEPNEGFNIAIKNINFDITGKGHAGAVAIRFAGAQGCVVEDVDIDATDAFAGFYNAIGVMGGYYNVKVTGGQYGFYFPSAKKSLKAIAAGVRLYFQKSSAIFHKGRAPFTITGFHIKSALKTAVKVYDGTHPGSGCISLVDGIIELHSPSSTAIGNKIGNEGKNVYLKDVYIRNAQKLILRPNGSSLNANSSGWIKVNEYIWGKSGQAPIGKNLIDGAFSTGESKDIVNPYIASVPTANSLIHKYVWKDSQMPSWSDPDVQDITKAPYFADNTGLTDVTSIFEQAINDCEKIFLPKGKYKIKRTLVLKKNTKLFGVSKTLACIIPDRNKWNPSSPTPIITTVNDKDADSLLSEIWIYEYCRNKGKYLYSIKWQAGKRSILKGTFTLPLDPPYKVLSYANMQMLLVTGNGGGRIYYPSCTLQQMGQKSGHPTFRLYKIQNTTQPLTFFGLNTERMASRPQAEIIDSKNVQIFGFKSEGNNHLLADGKARQSLGITRSNNVLVTGFAHVIGYSMDGLVKITDSENTLIANIGQQKIQSTSTTLIEDYFGTVKKIGGTDIVGLFKRGNPKLLEDINQVPPVNEDSPIIVDSPINTDLFPKTIINDNFGLVDQKWELDDSTYSISSGVLKNNANSGDQKVSYEAFFKNFYSSLTFQRTAGKNNYDSPRIYFKILDENNYYYVQFNDGGYCKLVRVINDFAETIIDTVDLSSNPAANLDIDRKHTVEILSYWGQIIIKLDQQTLFSISDNTILAGKIGVGSSNATIEYDDFTVSVENKTLSKLVFFDDYSTLKAEGYANTDSSFYIHDGQLHNDGSKYNQKMYTKSMYRDFRFRVKVKCIDSAESYQVPRVLFRVLDDNNYYFADSLKTGYPRIYKVVNGVQSAVWVGKNDPSIDLSVYNTFFIQAEGNKITVRLNGVEQHSFTDNLFAYGALGVASAKAKAQYDDLEIYVREEEYSDVKYVDTFDGSSGNWSMDPTFDIVNGKLHNKGTHNRRIAVQNDFWLSNYQLNFVFQIHTPNLKEPWKCPGIIFNCGANYSRYSFLRIKNNGNIYYNERDDGIVGTGFLVGQIPNYNPSVKNNVYLTKTGNNITITINNNPPLTFQTTGIYSQGRIGFESLYSDVSFDDVIIKK